jgi:hypothetical protein
MAAVIERMKSAMPHWYCRAGTIYFNHQNLAENEVFNEKIAIFAPIEKTI